MRNLLVIAFLATSVAFSAERVWAMPRQESQVDEAAKVVKEKIGEVSTKLNESQTVKDLSAGLLDPIYQLAERMAVPWFHWAVFALMAAGVVSFALQLVLTKLLLLAQLKLNLAEVLSDALGLLISLVGLVLTTQAATENSSFTSSPSAVVSAAAVGLVAGFIFYIWGQRLELRAARSGNRPARSEPVREDRRGM